MTFFSVATYIDGEEKECYVHTDYEGANLHFCERVNRTLVKSKSMGGPGCPFIESWQYENKTVILFKGYSSTTQKMIHERTSLFFQFLDPPNPGKITAADLKRINLLTYHKDQLQSIFDSFSGPFVYAEVGLLKVDRCEAHEKSRFLADYDPDLIKDLNAQVKARIMDKIKDINFELSKWIKG